MPAAMSSASAAAQTATTGSTCSRRMPWRSTKAFWAPMATMSDSAVRKPERAAAGMATTLGARARSEDQFMILRNH